MEKIRRKKFNSFIEGLNEDNIFFIDNCLFLRYLYILMFIYYLVRSLYDYIYMNNFIIL